MPLSMRLALELELKQMNNTIDVLYPTHGIRAGAQIQFNPNTHTWTVWTKQGLERKFGNVTSYVRYMTRG